MQFVRSIDQGKKRKTMADKVKYFLKGLFIAALLFLVFKFGKRQNLKWLLDARKELLQEKLKNIDTHIDEMKEIKNSHAYGALDDGQKEKLNTEFYEERRRRERTINRINKEPDPEKDEEILAALKDIFAN